MNHLQAGTYSAAAVATLGRTSGVLFVLAGGALGLKALSGPDSGSGWLALIAATPPATFGFLILAVAERISPAMPSHRSMLVFRCAGAASCLASATLAYESVVDGSPDLGTGWMITAILTIFLPVTPGLS